jgi:hypothetical protein
LYNLCLLITITKEAFIVAGIQTNNTLILGDNNFVQQENKELENTKFLAKPINILLYKSLLIFNRYILRQDKDNIILVQKG